MVRRSWLWFEGVIGGDVVFLCEVGRSDEDEVPTRLWFCFKAVAREGSRM
jgi:hypothetical protein